MSYHALCLPASRGAFKMSLAPLEDVGISYSPYNFHGNNYPVILDDSGVLNRSSFSRKIHYAWRPFAPQYHRVDQKKTSIRQSSLTPRSIGVVAKMPSIFLPSPCLYAFFRSRSCSNSINAYPDRFDELKLLASMRNCQPPQIPPDGPFSKSIP